MKIRFGLSTAETQELRDNSIKRVYGVNAIHSFVFFSPSVTPLRFVTAPSSDGAKNLNSFKNYRVFVNLLKNIDFYLENGYNIFNKINTTEDTKMKVTKQSIIGDVLDYDRGTAEFFFAIGMHCLGCPASRGESIEAACAVHGTNADELVEKLNAYLASKN